MSRMTALLGGLAIVLVLVLWYFLLWTPRVDELAAVESQIEDVQASQDVSRSRIDQLQQVREQAPELQAELAAAESLLPRDSDLPSALRQLQLAADESGATLVSVAPARPEPVPAADPALYAMSLALDLQGSYFQIVDTLRRLEDPSISPRGFVWEQIDLVVDEHPSLTVSVTGRMFAVLPAPPADGADVEGAPDGSTSDTSGDLPQDDAVDGQSPTEDAADGGPVDGGPADGGPVDGDPDAPDVPAPQGEEIQ